MKNSLLLLSFIAFSLLSKAQSSSIYLQNNTALDLEIWAEQTGTHIMSSGEWDLKTTSMYPWEMKKEILETNRNTGVHNNETFFFNVFVAHQTDTFRMQLRLRGQFVGSDMDFSIVGDGFDHTWHDGGGAREESFTFGGIPVRLKYQADGTDAFWNRDIIFAVHDTRPAYSIDSTDFYDPNIINVLSYNVQFLPFGVSGLPNASERADEAPKYLSPWQDVVIVQEVFDDNARNNHLIPAMTTAGFQYRTGILNDGQFPTWNGGVMIFSKWPIELEDEYDYRSCDNNAGDCLAAKGVLYARVNKLGKKYHIFGTHVEAGGQPNDIAIKKEQFGEQRDFIAQQQIPADEAVILGGDMNTDANSVQYPDLIDSLHPIIPEHRGFYASTAVDSDTLNIIDHVWGIRTHLIPTEAETKVWILRGIDGQLWDIFDPSDHLPINGRFVYPDVDTPIVQMPNLCPSDSLELSILVDPNFQVQWYKNDTLMVGATNPSLTIVGASVADTGSYTCVLTYQFIVPDTSYLAHPNWPDTATQQFEFSVANLSLTALDMNPMITQQGDTLYSSSPTGNQWYWNGQAIAGATDSAYVVTQNGDYSVLVTKGACTSDTSNTANYTSINIQQLNDTPLAILAYPNPTEGQLYIAHELEQVQVQVFNLNGQRLQFLESQEALIKLDLNPYPKGVYFIQLTTNKKSQTIKIILR
ncbi:MAG: T9SS type A sorting domain-containing protein [Aureispira sp.]